MNKSQFLRSLMRVNGETQMEQSIQNNISTKPQLEKQAKAVINGMEFVSIANELVREYKYLRNGKEVVVVINEPVWLYVRPSGAHLVIDKEGKYTYYLPNDFFLLRWISREGAERADF